MQAIREFSRFAKVYNQHHSIQAEVAKKLVSSLREKKYTNILDLGCGRGEVYQNLSSQGIDFAHLTALDSASGMLALHPRDERVTIVNGDFNYAETFEGLPLYDMVLSSSALQWSQELETTLQSLKEHLREGNFAIFTSGTFRSLHECAGVTSPIHSLEHLREKLSAHFHAEFETVHYKLHFENTYAMLRYIKESGTSGGEKQLSYKQTKQLLATYPHDFLEFEVLFAKVTPKV